jgi:D-aminopeptidase
VIGRLPPGPHNAITDVAGVAVAHANAAADHTGVTVILPGHDRDHWVEPYPAGAARLNGAAEVAGITQIDEWGLGESPIFLTATSYVGAVYDAATVELSRRQPRIGRDDVVIPVVAECDPSDVCDVIGGPRPDEALVRAALHGAGTGAVAEGQVGAGVGMNCFDWAGGIGTSSRVVGAWTVGVLLLVNFGDAEELRIAGDPVGRTRIPPTRGGEGSCACIVATDAPLLGAQLERLARRAFLGLARTGSYGSNGSGEVAVAFSTANRRAFSRDASTDVAAVEIVRNDALNPLFAATVEAAEEAVVNALYAARTIVGARGTLTGFAC